MYSDDYLTQIVDARKEDSSIDLQFAIIARETADLGAAVRALQLCDDSRWRQAVAGQTLCVEHNPDLSGLSSDDSRFRYAIERLKRVLEYIADMLQMLGVVVLDLYSQRQ